MATGGDTTHQQEFSEFDANTISVIRMPHSHRELFYHFTWSTKHRFPYLNRMLGPILIQALHHKAAGLGCHVFAANHMPDHVHLLLYIPPSLTVARAVRELKGLSYHNLRQHCPDFGWQDGYGVTTLRRSDLPVVQAYIANQAKHHERAAVLDPDLEITRGDASPPEG